MRNLWGNDKADVPEDQCPECETELPLHREFCPVFDPYYQEEQP